MKNFFIFAAVICITANAVNAEPIVLTDILQQARDAQIKQEAKEKAEKAMMKPVTNNSENLQNCEQKANEKINSEELAEKK